MWTPLLGVSFCVACTPTAPPPAMPWLQGFAVSATSDTPVEGHQRFLDWRDCEEPCSVVEVAADVATGEGRERILASYSEVVVLDADGSVIARGGGLDPAGSADEVLAIAVGDTMIGAPVIAVTARSGGRRSDEVWLGLYRVGGDHQLEPLFRGVVERRDNDASELGSIVFVPSSLIYRAPGEVASTLWVYDPRTHRYRRGPTVPDTRSPTTHVSI